VPVGASLHSKKRTVSGSGPGLQSTYTEQIESQIWGTFARGRPDRRDRVENTYTLFTYVFPQGYSSSYVKKYKRLGAAWEQRLTGGRSFAGPGKSQQQMTCGIGTNMQIVAEVYTGK